MFYNNCLEDDVKGGDTHLNLAETLICIHAGWNIERVLKLFVKS